ncbi:MAG: 2'-deoxycytidine 5'-triphosphate deaminase [Solirubrobacteraceae bacterium]
MTAATRASQQGADPADGSRGASMGVLASQQLRSALAKNWITTSGPYRIPTETMIQPASMDLHLGDVAWPLRCSFLPDQASAVADKVEDLKLAGSDGIDLRDGAILERNRPYLVPLIEELRLPPGIRAKANPKSSTGRLDVFTRVITDRNSRFDEITGGYRGKLYLEIVPRSFAIKVQTSIALNQLRLISGETRMSDDDLGILNDEFPLLYVGAHPLRSTEVTLAGGLFLGLDLAGAPGTIVGYRAKRTSLAIDLTKTRAYSWQDYWEPVYPERGQRVVLEPEDFYLLMSAEAVCIPPSHAAEMLAYDPTAGELRTHYAGFFDPGFGYSRGKRKRGSRAALEVRARDVAFMVEHQQPVCKLAFERMAEIPDVLYGEDLGSNYQGQVSTLSKHFEDQNAGIAQMTLQARPGMADRPNPGVTR